MTKKVTLSPVELFLQKNWQQSYTLEELEAEGFGKKTTLFSRLNRSRYVYKPSWGKYQFTPWYREDVKSVNDAILEALDQEGFVLVDEMAKRLNVQERTVIRNLHDLGRKNGFKVTATRCFRISHE